MFRFIPKSSARRDRHIGVAAVIALGIVAASCGSKEANGVDAQSSNPVGYSYYRDSRIGETNTEKGASYDHDSRINDAVIDDSANHDSHINDAP